MKPPTTAIGWCHWASRWVAEGDLTAREGFLLVTMALLSNPNGSGRASRPTLAMRCACSVETVKRALACLIDRGLVVRVGKPRGQLRWQLNGQRNPKQLALEVGHSYDPPEPASGSAGVGHSRDPRVGLPGDPHSGVNPNSNNSPLPPKGGTKTGEDQPNGHKPEAEWGSILDQLRAATDADLVDLWLSDVQVARNGHGLTIDLPNGKRTDAEQIFSRALPAAAAAAGVPVRWAPREPRFTSPTTRRPRRRRREPR